MNRRITIISIIIIFFSVLSLLIPGIESRDDKSWISQVELGKVFNTGLSGENVAIAVIDTGIDRNHPAFENSRIQPGYDLVKNSPYPDDTDGHGTWVSGLIIGDFKKEEYYDSKFSGVAPNASIIPFRIEKNFNDQIESNAIRIAADTNDVDILVLSIGGRPSVSDDELNSLLYASKKGIIVVMAAGNGGGEMPVLPAGLVNILYPVAITVGSVDYNNKIAEYNNRAGAMKDKYLVALTSTDGKSLAEERQNLNHGVFSYSLIEGVKGGADTHKDGRVKMTEILSFVASDVDEMTEGRQKTLFYNSGWFQDFDFVAL